MWAVNWWTGIFYQASIPCHYYACRNLFLMSNDISDSTLSSVLYLFRLLGEGHQVRMQCRTFSTRSHRKSISIFYSVTSGHRIGQFLHWTSKEPGTVDRTS